jgi:lysophospholipase
VVIFWELLFLFLSIVLAKFAFDSKRSLLKRIFIALGSLSSLAAVIIIMFYSAPGPSKKPLVFSYIYAHDGTELHTTYTPAHNQKDDSPTILWVHGWSEHSARYQELASYMARHGFASIMYDHRGHGKSGGPRGYIDYFDQYLEDLESVYNFHKKRVGGKLFIVGHSMGGLVTIRFLQKKSSKVPISAAILSSPLLGIKVYIPEYKKWISKFFYTVYPRLMVPRNSSGRWTTHDTVLEDEYEKDAYVFNHATPGWYEAVMVELEAAHQECGSVCVPVHILMSGDDHIVDSDKTCSFYKNLPGPCAKELEIYPEMYHEIFNEVGKERPRAKLLSILLAYL